MISRDGKVVRKLLDQGARGPETFTRQWVPSASKLSSQSLRSRQDRQTTMSWHQVNRIADEVRLLPRGEEFCLSERERRQIADLVTVRDTARVLGIIPQAVPPSNLNV